MKIEDAQNVMRRLYLVRDRKNGIDKSILRTFEELAELSEAIRKDDNREHIIEEFGDVFAWLCSLANLLDVDLNQALREKYNDVCTRCGQSPCECP